MWKCLYFGRIILLNLELQVYGFSSSSTLKMLVLCFLFLMKICSHAYCCSSIFYVLFFSSCPWGFFFFPLSLIFKISNYDVTRHDFLELFCLDFTKLLEYVSSCLVYVLNPIGKLLWAELSSPREFAKVLTQVPVNVSIAGNRVDVIKVRWGHLSRSCSCVSIAFIRIKKCVCKHTQGEHKLMTVSESRVMQLWAKDT